MLGKDIADAGNSAIGNSNKPSARWAALDSQLERLANASDRMLADRDGNDRDQRAAV